MAVGIPGILVIRRDNIGDLVCTTPLVRALRHQLPNARIEFLAPHTTRRFCQPSATTSSTTYEKYAERLLQVAKEWI